MIKLIKAHNESITSLSIFPSGNLISVSSDKSIKIFDINFNVLQNIQNAHDDSILYVDIKDENNFVTCSFDKNIITWIKNNKNQFQINKKINNAHNDWIVKVIYYSNNYLISCSLDKLVKIWEKTNNNYQLITTLKQYDWVNSILLLSDKKIFISSGNNGTKLWNLNNFELIKNYDEAKCDCRNALSRINENEIIIGDKYLLKIISLFEKKIIKEIKLSFYCYGIRVIKEKEIILIGGRSKNINIYRNNYEYIQTIKNIHKDYINGFIELKNGLIASFSWNGVISIWSF